MMSGAPKYLLNFNLPADVSMLMSKTDAVEDSPSKDPRRSFFNKLIGSDEFYRLVEEIELEIDHSDIYGTGTVISPYPSGRLRHLMKVTGLTCDMTPDTIIGNYNRSIRRKVDKSQMQDIIAPHLVADYLLEVSQMPEYSIPYASAMALIRTEPKVKQESRLGLHTIKELYGQMAYAVDYELFEKTHKMLVCHIMNDSKL